MDKKEISNGVKTPNEVDLPNEVEVPEEFTPRYQVRVHPGSNSGMDYYVLEVKPWDRNKGDFKFSGDLFEDDQLINCNIPFSLYGEPEEEGGIQWIDGQINDLIQNVSWTLSILPESLVKTSKETLIRMIIHDQFRYPWIEPEMEYPRDNFLNDHPTVRFMDPDYTDSWVESVCREVEVDKVIGFPNRYLPIDESFSPIGKTKYETQHFVHVEPEVHSPEQDDEFRTEMVDQERETNEELRSDWMRYQCLTRDERVKMIQRDYYLEEDE